MHTLQEKAVGGRKAAFPLKVDNADVWYDVYVQLEDDVVVVYAEERGQAMTKM
jgi:hypothetical protein